MGDHSPDKDTLVHHLPSIEEEAKEEEDTEEHFPHSFTGWQCLDGKDQFLTGTYAFMMIHSMICALMFYHIV